MCEPRDYRCWIKDSNLISFNVAVKQTDLYIRARRNLKEKALKSLLKHRASLEKYIQHHPLFLTTLEPYQAERDAPAIVKEMAEASQMAGVGPMAAVAGAIAEAVGDYLLCVDSDDYVEPSYIEKMIACAEKHPEVDYFYPRSLVPVDGRGRPTGEQWNYLNFSDNSIVPAFLFDKGYGPIPNPGSLKRRSARA